MTKKYELRYSKRAAKELKKSDKYTARMIYAWIDKNLADCENPRAFGKELVGASAGTWRYRIGNYRLICQICDDELVILALAIGHRKEIYCGK